MWKMEKLLDETNIWCSYIFSVAPTNFEYLLTIEMPFMMYKHAIKKGEEV